MPCYIETVMVQFEYRVDICLAEIIYEGILG